MKAIILLSLCSLLAACAGTSDPGGGPPPLRLDKSSSGSIVELQQGQLLELRLETNPSTGYDWRITKQDQSLLALESDTYLPPDNARVGQGGIKLFVFKPLERGSSVLELAYYRPWEGAATAIKWHQIIVETR